MSEAPERIWADGNADWDTGSWGLHKEYEGDVEYVRADRIEELEAKLAASYTSAEVEAAVKRALEGAAGHLSMFAEPGVSLDYSLDDEIKAIRALDPAQFVEGDKT